MQSKDKNKNKLEIMKSCATAGDKVFGLIVRELKKDFKKGKVKTEIELAGFIKAQIEKLGGKEAFPTIVTSGDRAGNEIHPVPTSSKLAGFVILDFGVKMNGYCSDMTRMVYVVDHESKRGIGKPSAKDLELYDAVLRANVESAKFVRAGLPVAGTDAYARGVLSQHSYKLKSKDYPLAKFFIHTLGHGISKKVHEAPKIFFKSKEVFKDGQVITIEPGIYIPKTLGIRIEDMYIVTNDKPILLTKAPKKLVVISL